MALTPPNTPGLEDPVAETIRRIHAQKIAELQQLLMAGAVIVPGQVIASGGTVTVAHKLGRAPRFVVVSAPRVAPASLGGVTPGTILDAGSISFAGQPIDRTKVIELVAVGYNAAVTVDVLVL